MRGPEDDEEESGLGEPETDGQWDDDIAPVDDDNK